MDKKRRNFARKPFLIFTFIAHCSLSDAVNKFKTCKITLSPLRQHLPSRPEILITDFLEWVNSFFVIIAGKFTFYCNCADRTASICVSVVPKLETSEICSQNKCLFEMG